MVTLTRNGKPLRCLLVGYNGVGNTGSEIRLLAAIDDAREAFGPQTHLTIMTINGARTQAILPEGGGIEVAEVSFSPLRLTLALWNLARRHDVILLVEGSTFKQNWSVWLLHAYLWAANSARWSGNYAIAYAVDVGELCGLHALRTRHECERLALVITTPKSPDKDFRSWGSGGPSFRIRTRRFATCAPENVVRLDAAWSDWHRSSSFTGRSA